MLLPYAFVLLVETADTGNTELYGSIVDANNTSISAIAWDRFLGSTLIASCGQVAGKLRLVERGLDLVLMKPRLRQIVDGLHSQPLVGV